MEKTNNLHQWFSYLNAYLSESPRRLLREIPGPSSHIFYRVDLEWGAENAFPTIRHH